MRLKCSNSNRMFQKLYAKNVMRRSKKFRAILKKVSIEKKKYFNPISSMKSFLKNFLVHAFLAVLASVFAVLLHSPHTLSQCNCDYSSAHLNENNYSELRLKSKMMLEAEISIRESSTSSATLPTRLELDTIVDRDDISIQVAPNAQPS